MTKKKEKTSTDVPLWGWVWVGEAEFVPGLPRRDIPLEEAADNEWIEILEQAAVYGRAYAPGENE